MQDKQFIDLESSKKHKRVFFSFCFKCSFPNLKNATQKITHGILIYVCVLYNVSLFQSSYIVIFHFCLS